VINIQSRKKILPGLFSRIKACMIFSAGFLSQLKKTSKNIYRPRNILKPKEKRSLRRPVKPSLRASTKAGLSRPRQLSLSNMSGR